MTNEEIITHILNYTLKEIPGYEPVANEPSFMISFPYEITRGSVILPSRTRHRMHEIGINITLLPNEEEGIGGAVYKVTERSKGSWIARLVECKGKFKISLHPMD